METATPQKMNFWMHGWRSHEEATPESWENPIGVQLLNGAELHGKCDFDPDAIGDHCYIVTLSIHPDDIAGDGILLATDGTYGLYNTPEPLPFAGDRSKTRRDVRHSSLCPHAVQAATLDVRARYGAYLSRQH